MLLNAFKIFIHDVRINDISRLWTSKGLSLSRLFDYSLVINCIRGDRSYAKDLLDAGCGFSCFPSYVTKYFRSVTAFDINESALKFQEKVKRNLRIDNLLIARGGSACKLNDTGVKLPFNDGAFDAVTSISVLEHIKDDLSALKELKRVLKEGGKIILMVPYAPKPRDSSIEDEAHFHRFYTKERLLGLFAEAGLNIKYALPYTFVIKSLFERFVYRYWPRNYIPIINLCVFFPLSLADLSFLRKNYFYDSKFLGRYNSPGHYVIVLTK